MCEQSKSSEAAEHEQGKYSALMGASTVRARTERSERTESSDTGECEQSRAQTLGACAKECSDTEECNQIKSSRR